MTAVADVSDTGKFELIETLYAGTLDDAAWDRALLAIADSVRASAALLFSVDPVNVRILRDEFHRFDPSVLESYRRHWLSHDARIPAFMQMPVGCPFTERMVRLDKWDRSAFLNEFLRPADVPYFMPAWLHKSPNKVAALSLQGSTKRGPFEREDLETFRQLLPHVSRALEIRDRLQRAHIRADTLAGTLDNLSLGVLILDSSGRILETNGVAQELLREASIGRRQDGTLWLRNPAGVQLARWIHTGVPANGSADGLLHVPRAPGLPLSVLVTPLPGQSTTWMGGDPRWLLLLFDPERRVQASAEFLARDLGISAREAEVVALLVAGLDLQGVASRLRLSIHTVRTQLKSVFGKTGLRSQADVIRRVTLGPWVLQRPNTLTR